MSGGLPPEVVYAILNGRIGTFGATQEQVNTAVNKYLTDNPVKLQKLTYNKQNKVLSLKEVN